MNSSAALNLLLNPFLMWSRLAWKTGEMAIASAQVIGLRTKRIALAGSLQGPRNQREFALTGKENGAAAMEWTQAVSARILMLNQQFAALAFKQVLSASASLMSIAASRSAAESVERQSKLARDTMASSIVAASKVSGSTAQLARRALKPVHARVSANVRRLGKNNSK